MKGRLKRTEERHPIAPSGGANWVISTNSMLPACCPVHNPTYSME
jgi:hypothetical protein